MEDKTGGVKINKIFTAKKYSENGKTLWTLTSLYLGLKAH